MKNTFTLGLLFVFVGGLSAADGLELEPLPPAESMAAAHVAEGFELQLIASEPLVRDPVAFDWRADGALWVAEMADYPLGMDDRGKHGGRVRLLTDRDGDGRYDHSTIFLDGLSFPAGIMAWRGGVLVASAPIVLFAKDTDGDGRADVRRTLFEGFFEGNHQLRINGLNWGLDNRVHGASGAVTIGYGGANNIRSGISGKSVMIRSGDFRFDPDTGWIEPTSGPSQYGRVRDDWGNWFGVHNSHPLWHYVLPARYFRRNPDVSYPDTRRQVRTPRNPRVFANKPPQKRFHSFEQSGRFTSACGPSIYRDTILFGRSGVTHAFTCEPFHNVIQRSVIREDGVSFSGERADDGERDFFASADRWSRPVFTRTGPDGALWFADMYRYMIEHPHWLPKNGQDELRPHFRSGDTFGRIYRIVPKGKPLREVPRLAGLKPAELVDVLSSENGTSRDMAHRLLIEADAKAVAPQLRAMLAGSPRPRARLHALAALDGLGRLDPPTLGQALDDNHPYVRRLAFRLTEKFPGEAKRFAPHFDFALGQAQPGPEAKAVLQQFFSAGFLPDNKIGESISVKAGAVADSDSPFLQAAYLTAADAHYGSMLSAAEPGGKIYEQLMLVGIKRHRSVLAGKIDDTLGTANARARMQLASLWMKSLGQAGIRLAKLDEAGLPGQTKALLEILTEAERLVLDTETDQPLRLDAIEALGHGSELHGNTAAVFQKLLAPSETSAVRHGTIRAVGNMTAAGAAKLLLAAWPGLVADERASALDVLLSRGTWQEALLQVMESGQVSINGFSLVHRDRLLKSANKAVAKRARGVFANEAEGDRAGALAKFAPALKLGGDAEKGRLVYDMHCAVCHAADKQLGPDLRSITDRSPEGLLASIIDPSRQVDPKYLAYTALFNDGRAIVGIITSGSGESLKINVPGVGSQTVNRSELKSLTSLNQSLMPAGLEQQLTHQSMADLIRFLQDYN